MPPPNTRDDRWQSPAPQPPPASSRSLAVVVALTAFATAFRVGVGAGGGALDGSWSTVMSWAFSHKAQFGSDIVFTYGPLGFLTPIANYYPATAGLFFAAQIFLSLTWALLAGHLATRLRPAAQIAMILLLLAWTPLLTIDVSWYLMFVSGAILMQQFAVQSGDWWTPGNRGLTGLVAVTVPALTILALTKFTCTLIWAAFVAYSVLQLLAARRPRAAVLLTMLFLGLFAGLWLACGQRLGGLPDFLVRGFEISNGYAAAMSITPPVAGDLAGLVVLALAAACLLALLARGDRHGRMAAGFLLFLLLLAWKAGYTRADGHVGIFLGTASLILFPCAALLIPAASRRLRQMHSLSAALATGLGLAVAYLALGGVVPTLRNGFGFMAQSLQQATSPPTLRQHFQKTWEDNSRYQDMPATRGLIGDAGVDLLMHEQSIVLLNDFRYRPRPVFQGYAANTTLLARRNESFLLGADAPRFLLYKPQTIDNHLPGGEDPLAQLVALRAYSPRAYENGFVVLEHSRPAAPVRPPPGQNWKSAAFGSEIPLEANSPQLLFYHVELNLLGKLYALVLREPDLGIELTLENGGTSSYKLVRSLGDAGVLVSPVLGTSRDYLAWYTQKADPVAGRLRLSARHPGQLRLFSSTFTYALEPVDLPRADPSSMEHLKDTFYPGFSHLPQSERSPVPIKMIRNLGADMLFLHAPSGLDFVLPRGRWRAEGRFGLREDVYAGACPQSDGALLRIYRQGAASAGLAAELLFSRQIDPLRVADDRGNLDFSTPAFNSDGNTPVTIEFSGGEAANATTDCDWTVLGPLHFVPVTDTSP